MAIGQEIILYFEIIPLISFLICAIVKSYIEDKKAIKKQIWRLKRNCINQIEEVEKKMFLMEIKKANLLT